MTTTKPSREEVLRVAGRHGARAMHTPEQHELICFSQPDLERFAAAMYAKGAEDMREPVFYMAGDGSMLSAAEWAAADDRTKEWYWQPLVRALPITPTNTEGEQDEFKR